MDRVSTKSKASQITRPAIIAAVAIALISGGAPAFLPLLFMLYWLWRVRIRRTSPALDVPEHT